MPGRGWGWERERRSALLASAHNAHLLGGLPKVHTQPGVMNLGGEARLISPRQHRMYNVWHATVQNASRGAGAACHDTARK